MPGLQTSLETHIVNQDNFSIGLHRVDFSITHLKHMVIKHKIQYVVEPAIQDRLREWKKKSLKTGGLLTQVQMFYKSHNSELMYQFSHILVMPTTHRKVYFVRKRKI